jgi:bla regulator protein blaR1
MITETSSRPSIKTRVGWCAVPLWVAMLAPAVAQTPASPSFEVASIKPNRSGDGFINMQVLAGGRVNIQNMPVAELIRIAYGVQPFQIDGGPGWVTADRFDVAAKAETEFPPGGPGQALQPMMRSLLVERFGLRVRRETKEMPIYALTLARSDGRLGPKLNPSTVDCAAVRGRGAGRGGPPAPPGPGERPECGFFGRPGSIAAGGVPLDQVAQMLSGRVRRTVVNKTGLAGNYSFDIEFTPDQMPPPGAVAPLGAAPIDPNGPSIFTALQEQLGLKLDSQRGPVEMLVIESVSRPTPD